MRSWCGSSRPRVGPPRRGCHSRRLDAQFTFAIGPWEIRTFLLPRRDGGEPVEVDLLERPVADVTGAVRSSRLARTPRRGMTPRLVASIDDRDGTFSRRRRTAAAGRDAPGRVQGGHGGFSVVVGHAPIGDGGPALTITITRTGPTPHDAAVRIGIHLGPSAEPWLLVPGRALRREPAGRLDAAVSGVAHGSRRRRPMGV